MYEIIINFLISVSGSAAFYYIHKNLKLKKNSKNTSVIYSEKYLSNLKKQFYICYGLICLILVQHLFPNIDNFLLL